MIRDIVRLPLIHMGEAGAWLIAPIGFMKRMAVELVKPFRSCQDDHPSCHRYSPEGHASQGIPPSDFLRILR